MSIGNVRPGLDFGFLFVYRFDGIRFRRISTRLNTIFINTAYARPLLIEWKTSLRYLVQNEITRRHDFLV